MTKNQIVKFIKIYISSNYSGKPFYKMEFNPKKYLDDEISIYSLKLISSGNVDFQNLLPSLEVIAKHNSFNDENLSVDITLRNQNNTLFAPIHIGLREYQFMTKNQLVKIIDEKLFEVYDLNFCQNELSKKYNNLSKIECNSNYNDLLLVEFNNKWTHLGYPSIIEEKTNGKYLSEILEIETNTETVLNILLLAIHAKTYFFNNRQELYNHLIYKDNLFLSLDNSLSLHHLIDMNKNLPTIFLKDENLWITQERLEDKNNKFSDIEDEIYYNIQLFRINKSCFLKAKIKNEKLLIKSLKTLSHQKK